MHLKQIIFYIINKFNSLPYIGNPLTPAERSTCSRCSIHSNTIRPIAPQFNIGDFLSFSSSARSLRLLDPSAPYFLTEIYPSPTFNKSTNTFLKLYDEQQLTALISEWTPGPKNTKWTESVMHIISFPASELFAGSIFNCAILSLPNEIYYKIRPADLALMVAKYQLQTNKFFASLD